MVSLLLCVCSHVTNFVPRNETHFESAAKAVEMLNGKTVNDKMKCFKEQPTKERQQRYQGVTLYIKNLEEEITDEKLREEFKKFGTITSAKVSFIS